MEKKKISRILKIVGLLLLVPLLAMQFTDEVNWAIGDFGVAAVLLTGVGILIELALKMIKSRSYQTIAILAIVTLFLLFWAELAVGILGLPFGGS